MERPGPSLLNLPPEVLVGVYLQLPVSDRLDLRRTCSFMRAVYDGSPRLQYEFTLHTTAYMDLPFVSHPFADADRLGCNDSTADSSSASASHSPSCNHRKHQKLSAQEANELLADRERRWETMDPKHRETIRLPGRAWIYELQEGIFLLCHDQPEWNDDRPTAIQLIPLPSAGDPDGDSQIMPFTRHRLPFGIADLTMDPTQDLIVVSEYRPAATLPDRAPPMHRYHLLSLSTLQPHPLAQMPTLDFPPFAQVIDQTQQLLQVMGDSLVVLVSRFARPWFLGIGINAVQELLGGASHEEELVAWNWKEGRVLARMTLPENVWFSSFALLTPTTFMITTSSPISHLMHAEAPRLSSAFPPCIQIYSFAPPTKSSSGTIVPHQPLEADYMDDTTPRPVLLAQLNMPTLEPDVSFTTFAVRPDPPYPGPGPDGPSLTRNQKQFTQDPSKGVLVFDILMARTAPDPMELGLATTLASKGCELFVLRETLVGIAEAGEERMRNVMAASSDEWLQRWSIEQVYHWDDWGRKQARLLDVAMARRNWVCSCSGYRYISLDRDPASGPTPTAPNIVYAPPYKANLRLLDFSPYFVKRLAAKQGNDLGELVEMSGAELPAGSPRVWQGVFTEPSVMPSGGFWRDDVHSSLPYVVVVREEGVLANGVMMDDQRIMIVASTEQIVDGVRTTQQTMHLHCM